MGLRLVPILGAMSLSGVIGTIGLAMIQGALVLLPRADALSCLRSIRSPAWAAVLPGVIIIGTFAVLLLPSTAYDLVVLAAVATPLLATGAALAVVRGRALLLALAPVAIVVLITQGAGWIGEGAASVLTALGCLFLGGACVRVVPARAIPVAVLAMCAVDVALMALGFGQSSWVAMSGAAAHFHGPVFDQARIGPVSTDYPDLFLAGVMGVMLAGRVAVQRHAAALTVILVSGYGLLALILAQRLPATVPIVLALTLVGYRQRSPRTLRLAARGGSGHEPPPVVA
jgi:hypothetical protein